jgi:HEAT repeat protein
VRLSSRLLACALVLAVTRSGPAQTASIAATVPDDVVQRAIATLIDPPSPEDAQDAARTLARAGEQALLQVDAALEGASWYARAALVGAVAEMESPEANDLLVPAARDRSFAVREAAAVGLGKIGVRESVTLLLELGDPQREPVWRVRAAASTALRRAVLRGLLAPERAEPVLVAQLADADPDARRAALRAVVPLGLPGALPHVLAIFDDPESDTVDRALALAALRLYRDRPDAVLPALRRGLLETDEAEQAAAAGAALLDLGGAAVLADEQVAHAVLRQLGDAGAPALRAALGRLGPDAVPWLAESARALARRIAQRRVEHQGSPLELVVEALLEIRREEAFTFLRDVAVGPEAEVMAPATRRFALRKIQLLFAPRLAAELRTAFDSHAGDGVRRALLLAIEASGGDDLAQRLDAALAHEDGEARWAAVDLLKRRPDLSAGPVLVRLAADGATPARLREHALEALARRDPGAAADVARELAAHGHADVRQAAAELLARAGRESDAELVRERLAAEDGKDSRTPRPEAEENGAVTPSSPHIERNRRRRVRRALLSALQACLGEGSRDELLATLGDEEDAVLRETAARLLRPLARDADDVALLAALDAEENPSARRELLATLATLGGSERVRDRFEAMLASSGRRWDALMLLRSEDSRVRPRGLEKALDAREWNDEEREVALVLLERDGRTPPPERLIALAQEARSKALAVEALRLVAETAGERAGPLLAGLLDATDDPEKIALAVEQIGALRFRPAVPALVDILDAWRSPALRASLSSEPALEVYRRAAVALGRCGTTDAGDALARHLLDPEVARAVVPYSATGNGPFKPAGAPPVRAVRAVVSALSHLPPGELRRLIRERLDALAATGDDARLAEEYVDGIARYLRDPGAYNLPQRRRPTAALPLMEQVLRTAPRLSPLDVEMQRYVAEQLENEKRFDEAVAAHERATALADVEEAWRSPERRLAERGKHELLRALARHAAGDRDAATAVLDAIREPDPTSGALAYYQGYGRAKIGLPDGAAREALRQTVTVDEAHARAHLWLGWVTESLDGASASLGHYAEALRLDRKRVRDAGGRYLTHRRGKVHRWSSYPYWYARALARAGDDALAQDLLHEAIVRDDRMATQALSDPAFERWDELSDLVAWALDAIPDSE